MKKAIPKSHGGSRPGAGRPATGKDPLVTLRMPEALLTDIERWSNGQSDQPVRSAAIRRLVEIGLSKPSDQPSVLSTSVEGALRAAELARKVIKPKKR